MRRALAATLGLFLSCQSRSEGPDNPGSGDPCNPTAVNTESGRTIFAKRIGGTGNDRVESIATDASGGALIAGQFEGTVDFGGQLLTASGASAAFLARYGAGGELVWARRPVQSGQASLRQARLDSSGAIFAMGSFSGTVDFGGGPLTSAGAEDLWLGKFAADGAHLWSRRYGGTGPDYPYGVIADENGDVVLVAEFQSSLDFAGQTLTSAGVQDILIMKHGADGSPRWAKAYGDSGTDRASGLQLRGKDLLISAQFSGTIDFGGGPLTPAGDMDMVLLALASDGGYRSAQRLGGTGYDGPAFYHAVDGCGAVTMTGLFYNETDLGGGVLKASLIVDGFLAHYAQDGKHLWSRGLSSPSATGTVAAAAPDNTVWAVGMFYNSLTLGQTTLQGAGQEDIFVTRLLPDGTHLWARSFGSSGRDSSASLGLLPDGSAFLAGTFTSTLDLGTGPLTSAGADDIFLVRLSP